MHFYPAVRLLFSRLKSRSQKIDISTQFIVHDMSVWQEPPYVQLKKDRPTSNEDFVGYIPDLLVKLASQPGCDCNFTLKLVEDGKYGVQETNLEWSGMIGEVISGVRILNVSICFQL